MHLWKKNRVLYYRFADKVMTYQVTEAILHVHIRDTGTHQKIEDQTSVENVDENRMLTLKIQISRVSKSNEAWTNSVVTNASVAITREEERTGKWVKVNVTSVLAEWFEMPRNVLGLVVRAQDSERRRIAVPESKAGDTDDLPYLEVHLKDTVRPRMKRMVSLNCNEHSTEARCCRYPLTVDFEEFGWDWVIAPKRYEANYCLGNCPYAFLQKDSVTHIVHLAAPTGYPGPCCTPRKMSSISLLHFTQELNIALNSLPAMIIEKCGCS